MWKTQPTQTILSRFSELTGVAARSPADVWAVGYRAGEAGVHQTLIEHWNGHRWHNVQSPNPAGPNGHRDDGLSAICAVPGSTALWAVGSTNALPLVIRRTGRAWVAVHIPLDPLPKNGRGDSLTAVAASKRSVWAIGTFFNPANLHSLAIALRHTSSGWSLGRPVRGDGTRWFSSATHVPHHGDFWAVGHFASGETQPLAEHWSPPSWTVSAVHDLDPSDETAFTGVGATGGKVLAVGCDFIFGTGQTTLAELRQ